VRAEGKTASLFSQHAWKVENTLNELGVPTKEIFIQNIEALLSVQKKCKKTQIS
jgi:hypothetical protein